MTSARVSHAIETRKAAEAAARAIVVTGDEPSRLFWDDVLGDGAAVIAEQGRKGNFLGALQAFRRLTGGEGDLRDHDQLVMLVGSGSRLSPITQALRNMKAAFVLPIGEGEPFTVGEAAIRSTAPWIRSLRDGGFDGLVVRWGDEVLIPSTSLTGEPGAYADVDAVRFGYRATPTELLASQKEWLVSDAALRVQGQLPRQPLASLTRRVDAMAGAAEVHVNLGSFAISHALLAALETAYADHLDDPTTQANWDPYLWMALHSDDEASWEADCCVEPGVPPKDLAALLAVIPDFWARARVARERLEAQTGRPYAARILDFGEPYWFDAGNHVSLRDGLADVFRTGEDGDTVRALLGLPAGLARGESHVVDSAVAEGVRVRNSVVIGSSIGDPASALDRAIVVHSRLGRVEVGPGGMVVECASETLRVAGPGGLAFRVVGEAEVGGDEVVATVGLPADGVRLSHRSASRIVDDAAYRTPLPGNPVSFREAADLVDLVDPLVLRDQYAAARHRH